MTFMHDEPKAQVVVDALIQSFPTRETRLSVEEIESLMRPFAPISYEVERRIALLLGAIEKSYICVKISAWLDANNLASGDPADVERRLDHFHNDPCECVLSHLQKAIQYATRQVDERVLALLGSEYFKK